MACQVAHYRGWVAHAAEGCETCTGKLRIYNRDAKRAERQRKSEGIEVQLGYSPEVREKTVKDAARIGVKRAAERNGVSVRATYKWLQAAGVKPGKSRR